MATSIEHLRGLYYQLTAAIPATDIEDVFERKLRRECKSDAASRETRQQAWDEALNLSRELAFKHALKNAELRAVGEPEYAWVQREFGQDCEFTATFEVFPAIDLGGLAEVEIESPATEITDADTSRALDVLREGHKVFKTAARAAQWGDCVTFDFDGRLNAESFDGGSKQGVSAVLGEADVLGDMETALIGCSAGDTFDVELAFPDDYPDPSLLGERAEFHIAVHSVASPEFPEFDPDFVRKLGVESGSLDELRSQVRGRLESECERTRQRYQRRLLIDALLEAVPVTVPEILLGHEIERLRAAFEQESNPQDAAGTTPDIPVAPLKATAERRLRLSLILSEIIRQHKVRLDPNRVEIKLDQLAAGFALPDASATKRQYRDNSQVMHNVQALVIEEQGFEAALQSVRTKPVSMSFDTLLQASG